MKIPLIKKPSIKLSSLIKYYILIFSYIMLIYYSLHPLHPVGEWDDYSLPVASILNDHDFAISKNDIEFYKKVYPAWSQYIDNYRLSGYTTKDGTEEMTWYFPVYSIACIPFTVMLHFLNLPTVYAFPYTNLTVLIISLCVVLKYLNTNDTTKAILIAALSTSPISLYILWPSAEVLIYSLMVISFTFWYNKMYKRAAFFISAAGMLNPTIMSVGFFMIAEYIYSLLKTKGKEPFSKFITSNLPDIVKYGCCYIIGIIPMLYNYYNTGHINLTAGLNRYTNYEKESTISRFFSYLFDLNFGIFPYFPILLILSIFLFIAALFKKNLKYIIGSFSFLLNIMLYSIMTHINSGMECIARYSVWGVLSLIFFVILFYNDLITGKKIKRFISYILIFSILLTGFTVLTSYHSYIEFSPIAKYVLDNYPSLYNPLHSTFNSRVNHIDGEHDYKTPIMYLPKDEYIRKILTKSDDKELLFSILSSDNGYDEWLKNEINNLSDSESYISCSYEKRIICAYPYNIGDILSFKSSSPTANKYVVNNIYSPESWGTWTSGNSLSMHMKTDSLSPVLHGEINANVYNNVQSVTVYVNDKPVFNEPAFKGGTINFDFENPGKNKPIKIRIELPGAISPSENGALDTRTLALGMIDMVITE